MEKELSQLRLNYADTLAAKESLTSSQTILVEELNEARFQIHTQHFICYFFKKA